MTYIVIYKNLKAKDDELNSHREVHLYLKENEIMTSEEMFAQFLKLTDSWEKETRFASSMTEIEGNKNLEKIIDLGPDVLPFIFQDLKVDPRWWFYALEELTGVNPVKKQHIGDLMKMTNDWLKWAVKNKYIEE